MPWLIMDKVLFIHVPRCGGTSITKHHKVGYKARQGLNVYYKIGLIYYYYRYRLLENANFPLFSYENALVLIQLVVGIFVYFFVYPPIPAPYVMWSMATFTFTMSTIIFTAPVMMRTNSLRYALMMFQSKVLCGFGGETKYMVGTTDKGYLFHLTAKRAIDYGFVTQEQVQRCAFSIVRNPYSRMVSMYEYNKRPFESFEHFVKAFYYDYREIYIKKNTCECSDVYCHILPMFEYTHMDGEQVVSCVIKQEHLKKLVATNWEGSNVTPDIQKALTGIPHANKRSRQQSWQNYYTQELMDIVYEMYQKDFEIFGYETNIPGRDDLVLGSSEPKSFTAACQNSKERRKSTSEYSKMVEIDIEMQENGGVDSSVDKQDSSEENDEGQHFGSSPSILPTRSLDNSEQRHTSGIENPEESAARRDASVFVLARS